MNDEKTEFVKFKQAVLTGLNEFEQHWHQMYIFDPYRYPKHQTFEKWFGHVLEYATQSVDKH